MPAESGFSMKASPPLRVIMRLATRAMTGIIARAIRNAIAMPSWEEGWSCSKVTPSMSAAILPLLAPSGLTVASAPTSVAAPSDLDHNGLPEALDETYRATPAAVAKKNVPPTI